MPVIRFPSRRARHVGVIHPTTPRVGIFVQAQRARSTGPQAHLSPYVEDEERVVRGQVLDAVERTAIFLAALALGLHLGWLIEQAALFLGWVAQ